MVIRVLRDVFAQFFQYTVPYLKSGHPQFSRIKQIIPMPEAISVQFSNGLERLKARRRLRRRERFWT